jgi:hypothetical protein
MQARVQTYTTVKAVVAHAGTKAKLDKRPFGLEQEVANVGRRRGGRERTRRRTRTQEEDKQEKEEEDRVRGTAMVVGGGCVWGWVVWRQVP